MSQKYVKNVNVYNFVTLKAKDFSVFSFKEEMLNTTALTELTFVIMAAIDLM